MRSKKKSYGEFLLEILEEKTNKLIDAETSFVLFIVSLLKWLFPRKKIDAQIQMFSKVQKFTCFENNDSSVSPLPSPSFQPSYSSNITPYTCIEQPSFLETHINFPSSPFSYFFHNFRPTNEIKILLAAVVSTHHLFYVT